MAVAKKIELTANQLWVLKYILHEVASSEEGANGIYLTPKERVSLRQKEVNCKGMKKYIVIREFIEPNKIPRIIGQFETRLGAETFAWGNDGKCWVYEMSM